MFRCFIVKHNKHVYSPFKILDMRTKKSKNVDLEKKRFIFLELGLVLALGLCLAAFEWSSETNDTNNLGSLEMTSIFEEEIINTFEKPPPPEDKPIIEEPELVIDIINKVDDDKKVDKINFNSDVKDKNDPIIIVKIPDDIGNNDKLEPIDWVNVEDKPLFPGGETALLKFIAENTNYPEIPKENGVQGKVYIRFVINETGKVVSVSIAKGVDPYLDAEALRVINKLPNWTPGKQREKAVPVSFVIPINFRLY